MAELTAMDLTRSVTDMDSPTFKNIWLPPFAAADSEAVTVSSQPILPLSMASIMRSRVITLVTEAGESFSWAFFSYSTWPVAASINRALFPATSSSAAAAPAGNKGKMKQKIRSRHSPLRMAIPPMVCTTAYERKNFHMHIKRYLTIEYFDDIISIQRNR